MIFKSAKNKTAALKLATSISLALLLAACAASPERQAKEAEEAAQVQEAELVTEAEREALEEMERKTIYDRHVNLLGSDSPGYLTEHGSYISVVQNLASGCEVNFKLYGKLQAVSEVECLQLFELLNDYENTVPVFLINDSSEQLEDMDLPYASHSIISDAVRGAKSIDSIFLY